MFNDSLFDLNELSEQLNKKGGLEMAQKDKIFNLDVFGEIHTNEDRTRINKTIKFLNKVRNYEYLLLEEAVDNIALTKKEINELIRTNNTSIGLRGYQLALELGLKVIGIDVDIDSKLSLIKQFEIRERNMINIISEYAKLGNCAVIVGDTHLRTIETKELGKASEINKIVTKLGGTIYRADVKSREID